MQLRKAFNKSQLASSVLVAPALLGPGFALPQLCWPAGQVSPQLALLSARLEPQTNNHALNARLYTAGR